jgi:hypothetical protein
MSVIPEICCSLRKQIIRNPELTPYKKAPTRIGAFLIHFPPFHGGNIRGVGFFKSALPCDATGGRTVLSPCNDFAPLYRQVPNTVILDTAHLSFLRGRPESRSLAVPTFRFQVSRFSFVFTSPPPLSPLSLSPRLPPSQNKSHSKYLSHPSDT